MYRISGFGWLPDPPDHRDYIVTSPVVERAVGGLKLSDPPPPSMDLREYDSPIEDQGQLGSCTAQAVIGLVEHLQRKLYSRHLEASRLFLYKVTRTFLGWTGDTGAFIRSTIKALRLFGVCPEEYWPYNIEQFDAEPSAFCYAFAANYKSLIYYQLEGLEALKDSLAKGLPFTVGFSTFPSIHNVEVAQTGIIPMPQANEATSGGHAVMAVGYDDIKGALLVRNSWGQDWGEVGYGWLPYGYVTEGLSEGFWVVTEMDFVDLQNSKGE